MKCICGYSISGDFPHYKHMKMISPNRMKVDSFENMFVCPACGTLKVEIKEGSVSHLHGDIGTN